MTPRLALALLACACAVAGAAATCAAGEAMFTAFPGVNFDFWDEDDALLWTFEGTSHTPRRLYSDPSRYSKNYQDLGLDDCANFCVSMGDDCDAFVHIFISSTPDISQCYFYWTSRRDGYSSAYNSFQFDVGVPWRFMMNGNDAPWDGIRIRGPGNSYGIDEYAVAYVQMSNLGCSLCSVGTYSTGGTGSCQSCPSGTTTTTTGLTACDYCVPGYGMDFPEYSKYRISNNVYMAWNGYVSEMELYADIDCTDRISVSTATIVCAPRQIGSDDCTKAYDGSTATWFQTVGFEQIGEFWITIEFSAATQLRCVRTFGRDGVNNRGMGYSTIGNNWDGGILFEGWDGTLWHVLGTPILSTNTAKASVMDGCEACAAGTYETNRQCADCAAGTFSGTSLQTACVDCPADTYQPGAGASACASCPAGSSHAETASVTIADCECDAGYHGWYPVYAKYRISNAGPTIWDAYVSELELYANDDCTGVVPVSSATIECSPPYQNRHSTHGCTLAYDGDISTKFNSDKAGHPPGDIWVTMEFDAPTQVRCIKALGINGNDQNGIGYGDPALSHEWYHGIRFEAWDGDSWIVIGTPIESSNTAKASMWQDCAACPAGTYETNRQCADCAAGTFSGTSLQTACVDCPADTYQPGAGATACASCPAGSSHAETASVTIADCECDAGYHGWYPVYAKYRISNAGPTVWDAYVSELELYANDDCTGAVPVSSATIECSPPYQNRHSTHGCTLAYDGDISTKFNSDKAGHPPGDIWVTMEFDAPTQLRCIKALGINGVDRNGIGYGDPSESHEWHHGIRFEAWDGDSWIVIGTPIESSNTAKASMWQDCAACPANTFSTPMREPLVFDFTPHNSLAAWQNYAKAIGAYTNVENYGYGGVYIGYDPVGYIELPLPEEFDWVVVSFMHSTNDAGTVQVLMNGVEVARANGNEFKTFESAYNPGDVLKVGEFNTAVIGADLIIKLYDRVACGDCPANGVSLAASSSLGACSCAADSYTVDTCYVDETVNLARACGPAQDAQCPTRASPIQLDANYPSWDGSQPEFNSGLANDGNLDTRAWQHPQSFSYHSVSQQNAFWTVDLGEERLVEFVTIYNKNQHLYFDNVKVTFGHNPSALLNPVCAEGIAWAASPHTTTVPCSGNGRYLSLIQEQNNYFVIVEVQVMGKKRGACNSGDLLLTERACPACPAHAASPAGSDAPEDCVCGATFASHPVAPRIRKLTFRTTGGRINNMEWSNEFEFIGLGGWGTGDRSSSSSAYYTEVRTDWPSASNDDKQCFVNGHAYWQAKCNGWHSTGEGTQAWKFEFEFKGSAEKPLLADFTEVRWYWQTMTPVPASGGGTWEVVAQTTAGAEVVVGSFDFINALMTEGMCTNTYTSNWCKWASISGLTTTAAEDGCACDAGYEWGGSACGACANGEYKPDVGDEQACAACPGIMVSVDSTASAYCVCPAGHVLDGAACAACPTAHYKDNAGNVSTCHEVDPIGNPDPCCQCAANKDTETTASDDASDCKCIAGYGTSAPLGECSACGIGDYKPALADVPCTDCGTGETTLQLASHEEGQCVCDAGYRSNGDGSCLECATGTYQPATGATACEACPTGATSAAASTAATDCTCTLTGYAGPAGGPCVCAPGFYMPVAECVACTEGWYCPGGTARVQCPANSHAPAGSDAVDDCLCDAGHTGPDGGPCAQCAAGTYKASPGSAACADCADHTHSPAASDAATDCTCNAGYTGPDGGACAECGIGSYKDAPGSAACDSCAAGSETTLAAASIDESACVCEEGFGGGEGGGASCGDAVVKIFDCGDTHADITVSSGSITQTDNYWTIDSSQYVSVPGQSFNFNSNSEFHLYMRFRVLSSGTQVILFMNAVNGGTSVFRVQLYNYHSTSWAANNLRVYHMPSAVNVWRDIYIYHSQSGGWQLLIDGQTYSTSSATLYDGPVNIYVGGKPGGSGNIEVSHLYISDSPMTLSDAECGKCGGGGCEVCEAGKYKATEADAACTSCPADSSTPTTQSTALTDCQCNAGYTGANGGACTACEAGKYKDAPGSAACELCPSNMHSPAASDELTDCLCVAGHAHDLDTAEYDCEACAPGTYQDGVGQDFCDPCPANAVSPGTSTALTDCQCPPGFHGADGAACSACVAGTYKASTGPDACAPCADHSDSPAQSTAATDCLCNAGYTGPDGGACTECAVGKYKDAAGSAACADCLASETTAAAASTAEAACVCLAGYGFDGACQPCAQDHFKAGIGDDPCTECGEQAFAPAQSTSSTACLCNAGYTPVGNDDDGVHDCEACAAGSYKAGVNDNDCSSCPAASTSPTASDALTDCVCNSGYSGADGEACVACTANQYEAANACENCPADSQSPALSTAASDCKCNVGYTGPDGGACTACATDQYKDSVGSAACSDCTDFSASPAASQSVDACTCNAGYHHAGDGSCDLICAAGFEANAGETKCVGCGPGFYKAAAGDHSCDACPPNSLHTLRNQTSADVCYCAHGFLANSNGDCIQCPEGKFNNKHNDSRCFDCVLCEDDGGDGSDLSQPIAANVVTFIRSPAGYQADATGANIELCPVNHYNDGTLRLCEVCPVGTLSTLGGLTSVAQCVCQAGYERVDGSCQQCGHGFVKLGDGDGPCAACGSGATTLATGAIAYSACTCVAGHEPVGEACEACGAGFAKFVVSNASCIDCPDFSTLQDNGVHVLSSCLCDPGYTGPNGGACAECGSGYYKADYGPATCDHCGAHTVTPTTTATAMSACQCDAPTYEAHADGGPDVGGSCVLSCVAGQTKGGGVCVDCAYGTYKPDIGPHACLLCADARGAHVASRPGSDSADDCSCPADQLGLEADGFVVVDVGALSDDDLDVSPAAASVAADPARRFKDLQLTGVGGHSVEVAVGTLVLFRCEPRDCADALVPLYGSPGALTITTSADPALFTLRRHTRRALALAAATPTAPAWFDQAAVEALALEKNTRSGDYVFGSANEYSASHCVPCPPGMLCAEYV